MPPAHLPPTPGSSTDIRGKAQLQSLAPSITLPPAAVADIVSDRTPSTTPSNNGSDSSYQPVSPRSPEKNKRRYSATQSKPAKSNEGFALPPPPSRSRKIIQMKPGRDAEQSQDQSKDSTVESALAKTGRKKVNNPGATAAGRKTARKTAHSLIERRRRSKMNEEFGVLKDMIPACAGQEMHKLAILQASIEYLHYLERCISDLKSANGSKGTANPQAQYTTHFNDAMDQDEMDSDEDMPSDNEATAQNPTPNPSPAAPPTLPQPQTSLPSFTQLTTSAALSPGTNALSHSYNSKPRHFSISSNTAPSFSPYMPSQNTSPVYGPRSGSITGSLSLDASSLALTSPALRAQDHGADAQGYGKGRDDREAMAALLMLNSDRRSWSERDREQVSSATSSASPSSSSGPVPASKREARGGGGGGAMSVRDLLSH